MSLLGQRTYWQDLEELAGNLPPTDEFAELLPIGQGASSAGYTRRDFMRLMGLSSAAAVAACSRAPVTRMIPSVTQPEGITPGTSTYYASSCDACPAACGVLFKSRDGRPIKLEGNDLHPWSKGGLCARGQASVLSLYDASRTRRPMDGSQSIGWKTLDAAVIERLRHARAAGRGIRLVTPPQLGPTLEAALQRFLAAYPTARRVAHDPLGGDSIALGHLASHGVRALPALHFEHAKMVASFGADFLGTWLSPVAFTRQYRQARQAAERSRHFQLEAHLSLTGSNADHRWNLAPSDTVPALAALARRLGVELPAVRRPEIDERRIAELAQALGAARGESLVVTGASDPAAQALAAAINQALGNYGRTLRWGEAVLLPETTTIDDLIGELGRGEVQAVLFLGTNPVYDHPRGGTLAEALAKTPLTLSTADRRDETAHAVRYLAPDHHFLETWSDSQPVGGLIGMSQPAIAPLYETRAAIESLLAWAGEPRASYDVLRARWEAEVFPRARRSGLTFGAFWECAVRDGFAEVEPAAPIAATYRPRAVADLVGASAAKPAELELALYPSLALGDGRLANNGWLQELPDPIAKTTWGNHAALAPSTASRLGLEDGAEVELAVGGRRITLPVLVQPGTHPRAVAVALGYGRTKAGPLGNGVGQNAFVFTLGAPVSIHPTGRRSELARTQIHHSMEGRPLVREIAPDEHELERDEPTGTMWSGHKYEGHRWAMAIDLDACTGCSACVVACQAENNIPVVGAIEVRRRREMHWLRIDRYYAGEPDEPEVVHQPMLCQHCENAPCETVCPVLATVHSSEGLNQQVYNRCVGTRYCANNCPTKVRRFNWFDYPRDDETARLVLNPDVVVRSRGVMEKCSFCVQRIQAAKGRPEGRAIADGDVQTACQQSCPAGAVVFGDLNDPKSRVAALAKSGRGYCILPGLHLGPAITYLAKIRGGGA